MKVKVSKGEIKEGRTERIGKVRSWKSSKFEKFEVGNLALIILILVSVHLKYNLFFHSSVKFLNI